MSDITKNKFVTQTDHMQLVYPDIRHADSVESAHACFSTDERWDRGKSTSSLYHHLSTRQWVYITRNTSAVFGKTSLGCIQNYLLQKWHLPYVLDVISAFLFTFAFGIYFQTKFFRFESSLYFRRARILRIYFVHNINKFVLSLKIFLGVGTFVMK